MDTFIEEGAYSRWIWKLRSLVFVCFFFVEGGWSVWRQGAVLEPPGSKIILSIFIKGYCRKSSWSGFLVPITNLGEALANLFWTTTLKTSKPCLRWLKTPRLNRIFWLGWNLKTSQNKGFAESVDWFILENPMVFFIEIAISPLASLFVGPVTFGGSGGFRYGWRRFGGFALHHHLCQRTQIFIAMSETCPEIYNDYLYWILGCIDHWKVLESKDVLFFKELCTFSSHDWSINLAWDVRPLSLQVIFLRTLSTVLSKFDYGWDGRCKTFSLP